MPQIQSESQNIPAEALRRVGRDLLTHAGVREEDAALVADSLVESNLRGIDSHGIARLEHYLGRIEAGSVEPRPEIRTERKGPSVGLVHGRHGLGQLVMWAASGYAIELARESGLAHVAVCESSHCGALAYYGQHLARQGLVAIVFTHSDAMVAPHAAAHAFCGTNPICIVAPGPDDRHLCLDMATSCVPWNTVMNAAIEGLNIPPDWALNAQGKPTEDPNEVAAVRPAATYKGSGLGLMIDVLCSFLAGGPFGPDISKMYGDLSLRRHLGGCIIAIDIERYLPVSQFVTRIGELQQRWNAQQQESPDEPVLWPGQPELNRKAQRLAEGIPVGLGTLANLRTLAQKADVTCP